MVIQPLIRNPYSGYINPYYWVDDHPLLYGNNGSLDPGTHEEARNAWKCHNKTLLNPDAWFVGEPPNQVLVFTKACLRNIHRSWCLTYMTLFSSETVFFAQLPNGSGGWKPVTNFTGWHFFSFHISRHFPRHFWFPRSATNDRIIGKITLAGLFNQIENLVGGTILGAKTKL